VRRIDPYHIGLLLVITLVLATLATLFDRPSDAMAPAARPTVMAVAQVASIAGPVRATMVPGNATLNLSHTFPVRPITAALAPTAIPPTPTPQPTDVPPVAPVPTPAGKPFHVGLQVGHLFSSALPDELKELRTSTGAFSGRYTEVSLNYDIANRVAQLLRQDGVLVDILPATVPPGYDADVFVALHADGSANPAAHGFKLATEWRTSRASQQLLDLLTRSYAQVTGMRLDDAITLNMRGYYAFSYRRFVHSVARTTPAVIVEMGFVTNAGDRALMYGNPNRIAIGIANGIIDYLNQHNAADIASRFPPEIPTQHAAGPAGVDIRSAPDDRALVLVHVTADTRLVPFEERNGWYHVAAKNAWRTMGWVRKDQVVVADEQLAPPLDS